MAYLRSAIFFTGLRDAGIQIDYSEAREGPVELFLRLDHLTLLVLASLLVKWYRYKTKR
jgi:hypothetical protein